MVKVDKQISQKRSRVDTPAFKTDRVSTQNGNYRIGGSLPPTPTTTTATTTTATTTATTTTKTRRRRRTIIITIMY